MQPGKDISFVNKTGSPTHATVGAVTGTGDSGYKVLTVVFADGRAQEKVPHENDAKDGQAFWRLRGAEAKEVQAETEAPPGEPIPSGERVGSREPILPESVEDAPAPKRGKK